MATLPADEISIDQYIGDLERLSVSLPAVADQPLIMPKTEVVVPHHWRWIDLERLLYQALQFQDKLPPGQAGAERRIVRLKNPGLFSETITNTMSVAVQLLMPGEIARPHRHTPVAFRFFLEGGAYMTVEGEKHEADPGDMVLTPLMQWHDHGNEGSEPAIWIDGLDFPLVRFLDGLIKEDIETPQATNHSGTTARRFAAAGLRPSAVAPEDIERSSLIHYKWDVTEAALTAMAEAGDASPTDDIIFEYVNPATGESVFTTIACYIQMIRPGVKTRRQRETAHKVYQVFRGSGRTIINAQTFEWSRGDIFVIPSMAWHHHENSTEDPAILFSL